MAHMGEVFVGEGAVRFGLEYRDDMSDQGVCVHALGDVDGREVEVLRFDCFDHQPHYHYGPEKANERLMLDSTTEGDALEWVLAQIRTRLPDMVRRAGYPDMADGIEPVSLESTLTALAETARRMARERRSTAVHDRGDTVLEAGSVRFGIEFRELGDDRGIAIHVLGDVGDEEVELLTFDCFEEEPHYHYGPRAKNQRLYLDTTTVPDPLDWALSLFKGGKLAPMLERAGYPDHAARLNPSVLSESVAQVEAVAVRLREENAKG